MNVSALYPKVLGILHTSGKGGGNTRWQSHAHDVTVPLQVLVKTGWQEGNKHFLTSSVYQSLTTDPPWISSQKAGTCETFLICYYNGNN